MKKLLILTLATIIGTTAYANQPQSDARTAHQSTTKTASVKYTCQSGKKATVKYGFNRQNEPTYAQANVNGKARFMPINLYRSDATGTTFGDDNNFSLYGDTINHGNYRKAHINIQSPDGAFTHKDCRPTKR